MKDKVLEILKKHEYLIDSCNGYYGISNDDYEEITKQITDLFTDIKKSVQDCKSLYEGILRTENQNNAKVILNYIIKDYKELLTKLQ